MRTAPRGDAAWLVGLCGSRFLLALVFTSYAAVLPVLQREWEMSAAAAGGVAAAFQIGYAVSLVVTNLLSDRVGARPVFLWSTVAGARSRTSSPAPSSVSTMLRRFRSNRWARSAR